MTRGEILKATAWNLQMEAGHRSPAFPNFKLGTSWQAIVRACFFGHNAI
jgi:hypothetical protein